MCRVLKIPRSSYYYEKKPKPDESKLVKKIVDIFKSSRNNYGTRKIKAKLKEENIIVSRRKIGRIMRHEGLVSNYTKAKFHHPKSSCNESKVNNIVDRKFKNRQYRKVVVSDLTYVMAGKKWNYICVLIDLFNREIIGFSAGTHKNATLVKEAFQSVKGSLKDIEVFHTDRGNEFKNELIDDTLQAFEIKRSLSKKGCPYDNAVAEATFKIIKTEFVKSRTFSSLYELRLQLADYVNWFNHHRIHSALNYLTPFDFRELTLNISV